MAVVMMAAIMVVEATVEMAMEVADALIAVAEAMETEEWAVGIDSGFDAFYETNKRSSNLNNRILINILGHFHSFIFIAFSCFLTLHPIIRFSRSV